MDIGYACVSTTEQDRARHIDAFRRAGYARIYIETASGTRADRPELAKVLDVAWAGTRIVLWRLDRIAQSLRHQIDVPETLDQRGVGLIALAASTGTTTASGRFRFAVLGALARMEVELLRKRTRTGLFAAAERERRRSRPPALDDAEQRAAKTLLASGTVSASEVAKQVGCVPSTLDRLLPGG